jgi:hypothetical protein
LIYTTSAMVRVSACMLLDPLPNLLDMLTLMFI